MWPGDACDACVLINIPRGELVNLFSVEGAAVPATDYGLVNGHVEGLEELHEEILRRVPVLGHAATVVAVLAVCTRPLHTQQSIHRFIS